MGRGAQNSQTAVRLTSRREARNLLGVLAASLARPHSTPEAQSRERSTFAFYVLGRTLNEIERREVCDMVWRQGPVPQRPPLQALAMMLGAEHRCLVQRRSRDLADAWLEAQLDRVENERGVRVAEAYIDQQVALLDEAITPDWSPGNAPALIGDHV